MQAKLQDQLSHADAEVILERLPARVRAALLARAAEIEYPVEQGKRKKIIEKMCYVARPAARTVSM